MCAAQPPRLIPAFGGRSRAQARTGGHDEPSWPLGFHPASLPLLAVDSHRSGWNLIARRRRTPDEFDFHACREPPEIGRLQRSAAYPHGAYTCQASVRWPSIESLQRRTERQSHVLVESKSARQRRLPRVKTGAFLIAIVLITSPRTYSRRERSCASQVSTQRLRHQRGERMWCEIQAANTGPYST